MPATAEKTDPALWKRVVARVKRGTKGGDAGEWSARKAQLATAEYKKAGGGYAGRKSKDNHLSQWTKEEWGTKSGRRSKDTGERYLPRRAREKLSEKEYAQTTARKRRDTKAGKQHSRQPATAARKTATARKAAPDALVQEFREAVNTSRSMLERWLKTKRSMEVGQKRDGGESVGHASGRRIATILAKGRSAEYTKEERAHMRKVVGYVRRHLAQRPKGDVRDTDWRASLRNWGHDPLKG
ncbi:DUF3140 domain-containing protein [Sabulicella glaciei]|uniref:DUF3140 domain-containing protein n=1 Tax=Sabulicella glaciei TaxID=2984948 RepID=A0ABT3NQA2_9PROT|nr:DUF3140 domain-containing protein [Roseococcus sp. MDT2-1-1]MCW8084336.1 DUF3140 domain-containing protein [Roseococcus sp. MDT2-1-1]